MSFPHKVVVVTGASAGVGRAVARAFGMRGCSVGLIARGLDGLRGAEREIHRFGGRALVLPLDTANPHAVDQAAERVEAELGPIDVWVNNAMVSVFSRVIDMTPDDYKRVTDVTYLGYIHGTLSALRRMAPRNRGFIVQVGSALCFRGIPLQSAYCGAKHAIQGFTQSLRCELLHDGLDVKVPMVHLPAMNTPQFGWSKSRMPRQPQPVPPIYQPEIAADAIVWVTEHYRHHLYVGYPTVKAVWGDRFVPQYADHYLAEHGYDDQMTDEPTDPDRPNNLYDPVPGDHGAHGHFDDRASSFSPYTWATKHRKGLGMAVAGATVAAAAVVGARKWRAGRDGPLNGLANDAGR